MIRLMNAFAKACGIALAIAFAGPVLTASLCLAQEDVSLADHPRLKTQYDKALAAGDLARAAALAEQMADATEPDHVEALYAAAAVHARLGHREQAYILLSRAVGAGFYDRGRMMRDESFKDFRTEELFRSLARKTWANGYTDLLERPNREDVQKSPEIMNALAFKPGERVADIGAGTGYFTFQVAEAVGPNGLVWALDIAPEMLEFLDFRIKARKAENVKLRRVESDDPKLDPGSLNTILMVDAIHYVKDRTAYAKKLAAGLAPDGRLVIIDYIPKPLSERPWGPPPEQQFPKEQLDKEMAAAGFKVFQSFAFLPEQFFVIYVR